MASAGHAFGNRIRMGGGWNAMNALVVPGDFDTLGNTDLLARDSTGALWLYPGNGKSGFTARRQVGGGWSSMRTIVGVGSFQAGSGACVMGADSAGTMRLYCNGPYGRFYPYPGLVGKGWTAMRLVTA